MTLTGTETFTKFARGDGERLRRALIATFGPELGDEATADALAYGWENWPRIEGMKNPAGYLYQVGRNKARGIMRRRRRPAFPDVDTTRAERWVEPELPGSLRRLTQRQRAAVILVHGYGWTHREVAELLGIARSSVQQHVERGLRHLRKDLGVEVA